MRANDNHRKLSVRFNGSTLVVVALVALAVGGIRPAAGQPEPESPAPIETPRAQDDFEAYANQDWRSRNPLPATDSSWGTWDEMNMQAYRRTGEIIEEAGRSAKQVADGPGAKVGTFYSCGMDTTRIDAQGLDPLREVMEKIDALAGLDDLPELLALLHGYGINALFEPRVMPDMSDASRNALYLGQAGLGLPGKSFYFEKNDHMEKIRAEYQDHLTRTLEIAGMDVGEAKKTAAGIYAFESKLAQIAITNIEMRAFMPQGGTRSSELQAAAKRFDWSRYFKAMGGTAEIKEAILLPDSYFKALDSVLVDIPSEDLRAYLTWHLLRGTAEHLGSPMREEGFRFYGTVMRGQESPRPRASMMIGATNLALGDLVGQIYVQKFFAKQTRERVLELVENLKAALKSRISNQAWMSDETRKTALKKLDNMVFIVGHHDHWIDYSGLKIECGSHVLNVLRAREFLLARDIAEIGEKAHRDRFPFPAQKVGCSYSKLLNSIVFTAGFLQPPFFDPDAGDGLNYGCLGAAIGHELMHGFDDLGRHFDEAGNKREWWTESEVARFKELVAPLVNQFDGYEVEDGFSVSGEFTLGENMADLGGLRLAYQAMKLALEKSTDNKTDIHLQEQKFFLAWASLWNENATREHVIRHLKTDDHAPARFRVNGPLSNMPEFYEAFGVKPGDGMYLPPEKRTIVW